MLLKQNTELLRATLALLVAIDGANAASHDLLPDSEAELLFFQRVIAEKRSLDYVFYAGHWLVWVEGSVEVLAWGFLLGHVVLIVSAQLVDFGVGVVAAPVRRLNFNLVVFWVEQRRVGFILVYLVLLINAIKLAVIFLAWFLIHKFLLLQLDLEHRILIPYFLQLLLLRLVLLHGLVMLVQQLLQVVQAWVLD